MEQRTDCTVQIAYCEDNELQREMFMVALSPYLDVHPEVEVSVFSSGKELLSEVRFGSRFQIYILDIMMPEVNGMEVASALRMLKDPGLIIFLTSSVEYAVLSYEVNAFYYLTKPLNTEKLMKILDNALEAAGRSKSESVTVNTPNGIFDLKLKDILYVEVVDRAAVFYLKDGRECRSVKLRTSFHEVVPQLFESPLFASCGVSRLVNLSGVDAVDSESLLLSNGQVVYFPKSAYPELMRKWKKYRRI
ncbi:MAG: response regulator transcription factor [Eubacterium sp.]|nr:response regulator transcription factor [Eubacterium sp.]